ncbi:MAG TPA: hypothetical protein VJB96_02820 [Patescibacteria group bacterium]|nr:hypothetical protein [Patescibacteria group bacterium]
MITISYTITSAIIDTLSAIDALRSRILTTPISPIVEARLRWEAGHASSFDPDLLTSIRREWTGNPASITEDVLEKPKPETKRLCIFLNSKNDHPIILAGVACAALHNEPAGKLLTLLLFAKHGYDCRGMLVFEPKWEAGFEKYAQLTLWLEHFTQDVQTAYEKLSQTVTASSTRPLLSKPWILSTRHKRILDSLEHPAANITNRELARRFRVSQVTASRDLAHLTRLGILYAHGKGRSVYYTKL